MEIPDLKILETERLLLRELSPRVHDMVYKTYTDTDIKRFFGLQTDEELETERSKYKNGLHMFNKTYFIFSMIEKSSMSVIGSIGYHTWYTQHDRAEIFYMIRDESRRRMGYAKEALTPVIRYGFQDMHLNRIEAMLSDANTASVKLVTGAGFKKEGTLKKHYFINGQYEDSDIYGLLKSEY